MNQRMMDIARELSGDAVFTIDELAHRHGVSARTIRNDLNQIDDALRRAGEPGIRLERGGSVLCMGDATVLTGLGQSPLARAAYHLSKQERLVIEGAVVVATPGPTTLGTLAEAATPEEAAAIIERWEGGL